MDHFNTSNPRVIWNANFWNAVKQDYIQHYSFDSLSELGLALAAAGIFANTSLDENISHHWQTHIRGNTTDNISDAVDTFTQLRQIRVVIPVYLTAMIMANQLDYEWLGPFGRWGEHSIRVLLLGAPQQAILTELLGSGRPIDGDSGWRFFDSNRGVSGHAFYGAVPLISAAAVSKHWALKSVFYTLSTFPAFSRINSNKHYFSQAALGWGLAFLASRSVTKSNKKLKSGLEFKLALMPMNSGWLMGGSLEF